MSIRPTLTQKEGVYVSQTVLELAVESFNTDYMPDRVKKPLSVIYSDNPALFDSLRLEYPSPHTITFSHRPLWQDENQYLLIFPTIHILLLFRQFLLVRTRGIFGCQLCTLAAIQIQQYLSTRSKWDIEKPKKAPPKNKPRPIRTRTKKKITTSH